MSGYGPPRVCARCEVLKPHKGRGLCNACYLHCFVRGAIDDYPRSHARNWEVVEDYHFIRDTHGGTLEDIAIRLGVSREALYQALRRRGIRHQCNT